MFSQVTKYGLQLALLLPALARAKEEANNARCKNNLKQLGTAAVGLYSNNHGRLPSPTGSDWFATLYDTNTIRDAKIYLCPSDSTGNNTEVSGVGSFSANNTSYWGRRSSCGWLWRA